MVNLGPEAWDPTYVEPTPVRQAFYNLPLFQEVSKRAVTLSDQATIEGRNPTPDGLPICMKCKRTPDEIPGLVDMAKVEEMSAVEYAKDDGTYNSEFNMFVCDTCYVALGMPNNPQLTEMMSGAYTL